MKLLYVSDHRFHEIDGVFYSETQFPAAYWQRYLSIFDTIRVVGRTHDSSPTCANGLILSSCKQSAFALVPNHLTLRGFFKNRLHVLETLRREMDETDAVILKSPGSLGQYAAKIATQRGIPYAIEMVGCPFDALYNHGSFGYKIAAWFSYYTTRRQVRAAPVVTYVTKQFLQERYPSDAIVCVAASDVEIPALDKAVLVRRLARIDEKPIQTVKLGLIGGLMTKAKGHRQALEVLALLKKKGVAAHLDCVGGGDSEPYKKLARRLGVENQVTFKGSLPGFAAISKWLDEVDVYIQPIFQEGLPRALVETLSRACPSVVNRAGGMPELLPDCYIVAPNDASEMAEIIARIVANPQELAQMAKQNFAKSSEYLPEILEPIRAAFISEVASYVKSNNQKKNA